MKGLAERVGLPPERLSSKSWKKARVMFGAAQGEPRSAVLRRGNHSSVGGSRCYWPTASMAGNRKPSARFGVADDLQEIQVAFDGTRGRSSVLPLPGSSPPDRGLSP